MSEKHSLEELAIQEPKKVFVNMILIPNIRRCEEALYVTNPFLSVRLMRGTIACLDEKAKEELENESRQLETWELDVRGVTRLELEHLFSRLLNYLHENYLREFGIRAINPNPKHIGSEE